MPAMKAIPLLYLIGILVMATSFLVACDNQNEEGVSEEALNDFTTMMSNTFGMFSLLSIELAPAPVSEKSRHAADLFDCPSGGAVDFQVTNVGGDDNSITYALVLDDCNGLNGALTYDIAGEFTPSNIDLVLSINGEIEERCAISFTQFSETITAEASDENTVVLFSVDGRIGATCREESFACTFDNDSFDTSDTSFFENRCG
jgi:hypothetical protein